MKKGVKIGVAIGAGVLACGVVFGVLMLTRPRLDYAGAKAKVDDILSTKATVEQFLDSKANSLELSGEEKKADEDFVGAYKKALDDVLAIGAMDVLKDETVKGKYELVKADFERLTNLADIWNDVKLLTDVNDDNLAKLKQSKSEYLLTLAGELESYKTKLSEYKTKYDNKAGDATGAINAYGQLRIEGEALEKKYSKVTFDDVMKMSRDDIMKFYATIVELDKILSEKV